MIKNKKSHEKPIAFVSDEDRKLMLDEDDDDDGDGG